MLQLIFELVLISSLFTLAAHCLLVIGFAFLLMSGPQWPLSRCLGLAVRAMSVIYMPRALRDLQALLPDSAQAKHPARAELARTSLELTRDNFERVFGQALRFLPLSIVAMASVYHVQGAGVGAGLVVGLLLPWNLATAYGVMSQLGWTVPRWLTATQNKRAANWALRVVTLPLVAFFGLMALPLYWLDLHSSLLKTGVAWAPR